MTTTVVYADPGYDGYLVSSHAVYETARAGPATVVSPGASSLIVGQDFDGATYTLYEIFLAFDTNGVLPPGEVVTMAVLSLAGKVDSSTTDFVMEAHPAEWIALDAADWVPGDLMPVDAVATCSSTAFTTGYMDFVWDYPFASYVNPHAATELFVVSDRFRNDVAPTGAEYVEMAAAVTSGSASDPKLTITSAPRDTLGVIASSERWV